MKQVTLSGLSPALGQSSRAMAALTVLAGIAAAAWLAHPAGGAMPSLSHLAYLPVMAGAYAFGAAEGILFACIAGLALSTGILPEAAAGDIRAGAGWSVQLSLLALAGAVVGLLSRRARRLDREVGIVRARHPVTDLPAAGTFRAHLERRVSQGGCTLLLIDVDDEERVVAALGVECGHRLERAVAARLVGALEGRARLYHLRASQFAVILKGADRDRVAEWAAALAAAVAGPVELGETSVDPGARIGHASCPRHAADADDLVRAANAALRTPGEQVPPGVVRRVFGPPAADAHAELLADLRKSVGEGRDFALDFQPIVDLASGRCVAAEALLRWRHPERGAVPPDTFIPIAERSGLIGPLTALVARQALAACAAWHRVGIGARVAINLSARNLVEPGFSARVAEEARRHGLEPAAIDLEVTETATMGDPDGAAETLAGLKRNGHRIAIDDFGTGHSSLAYLKTLPVDAIKIDGAFMRALETDTADALIVRSTLSLADALGLATTVEGVERPEPLRHVRAWGATCAQGHHIASPMPLQAFTEWMARAAA